MNCLSNIIFSKKISFESFKNQIVFFRKKIEIKPQKWPPAKQLHPDGNLISIITSCSYSAKIKLQYIKNTFNGAHFHINRVLLTRNFFKEVHVPKSRGVLGTGFTYVATSGEPSTWFPLGQLVEQERVPRWNCNFFENFRNFNQK